MNSCMADTFNVIFASSSLKERSYRPSHLIWPHFVWSEWLWSDPVRRGWDQSEYSRSCSRNKSGQWIQWQLLWYGEDRSPSNRAASPTRHTSRQARVSEPTRLTNPMLLANPSHQHKRLLMYCRCRYFLIFPLLTYCGPRYIFFAQDGSRKVGVPEAEVVQNRQFISTIIRYVYFRFCGWSHVSYNA